MQEVLSQPMIPFGLQSCQNEVLLKHDLYFWKGRGGEGGGGGGNFALVNQLTTQFFAFKYPNA